jgi:hypothetical protein
MIRAVRFSLPINRCLLDFRICTTARVTFGLPTSQELARCAAAVAPASRKGLIHVPSREEFTWQKNWQIPFPAGPRFIHNTQEKTGHQTPTEGAPFKTTGAISPQPAPTGQAEAIYFRPVTITPEARRIAHILGIREAEYLVQRVLDAETTVRELITRVSQLEKQRLIRPPALGDLRLSSGCLAVSQKSRSKGQPESTAAWLRAACLLVIVVVSHPVYAGTITGQIQTTTGGVIANVIPPQTSVCRPQRARRAEAENKAKEVLEDPRNAPCGESWTSSPQCIDRRVDNDTRNPAISQ